MHNLHVNYCHIRFPHVDVQLWITPLQITLPCGRQPSQAWYRTWNCIIEITLPSSIELRFSQSVFSLTCYVM